MTGTDTRLIGRWGAAAMVAIMGVAGCGTATTGKAAQVDTDKASTADAPAEAAGEGWFAVRAESCEPVGKALIRLASEPGGTRLDAVLARENDGWCAIEPKDSGERVDGLAQRVATELETDALAFFIADGSWSCALFNKGFPVYQLESHYRREPVATGSAAKAARLTSSDEASWSSLTAKANDPAAHLALATALGVKRPEGSATAIQTAPTPAATAPQSTAEAPAKPTELVAGAWVVMPPFGIMLLKGKLTKEVRGKETECYDVAAGTQRLSIPVASAASLGMRALATPERAKAVLATIRGDAAVADAKAYHEDRARKHLDSLKRGDLDAIVTAFRELCTIRRQRRLYAIEDGLLSSTQDWLTEELALALERDKAKVRGQLRDACGD